MVAYPTESGRTRIIRRCVTVSFCLSLFSLPNLCQFIHFACVFIGLSALPVYHRTGARPALMAPHIRRRAHRRRGGGGPLFPPASWLQWRSSGAFSTFRRCPVASPQAQAHCSADMAVHFITLSAAVEKAELSMRATHFYNSSGMVIVCTAKGAKITTIAMVMVHDERSFERSKNRA